MSTYWMGSDDSWGVVVHAHQMVDEGIASGRFKARLDDSDEDGMPKLAEKYGDVGVVRITGSLVKGSAGWMRYFGVNGYDDIAKAMLKVASDPDVKRLLFYVDSGGGQVAGLAEFAKLVTQVSSMKPSATYTDSTMASAAYWIGSAVSGSIYAGQAATVGSLGVILVHMERSKQLAAAGITVNVLRAGEDKARMNPLEELTAEAREHAEAQLADLHNLFKDHVKATRPAMTAEQLQAATTGKTFIGKRAVAIGLVDRIVSYDQALKLLDNHARQKDTSRNSKGAAMTTASLTPQQLASIAFSTGKAVADLGIELSEDLAAAANTELERLQAEKAAADAAAAADQAGDQKPDAAVLAHLTEQLEAKTVEAATLKAQVATLTAAQSSMKEAHDSLLAIAREDLGRMMVAMGGTADITAVMDAAQITAKHAETKAAFLAKFPGGRQSIEAKEGEQKPEDKGAAPLPTAFRTLAHRASQSTK